MSLVAADITAVQLVMRKRTICLEYCGEKQPNSTIQVGARARSLQNYLKNADHAKEK
jgi:hypothetical protein